MKSEVAGENSTGKAKQFKIEEWLRIVEEPMGVLNDCGWIVCNHDKWIAWRDRGGCDEEHRVDGNF